MIFIGIGLAVLILLLLKMQYDRRSMNKKMDEKLKEAWGKVPTQEYSYEKLASIPKYYETNKEPLWDIDDITWNDLDMDRVYMLLNHTESSVGEEYLYNMLRKPQNNADKLLERNRLIIYFQEHPKERMMIQKKLMLMGKLKDISFYEYINRVDALETHKPYLHIFCMFLLPISLCTMLIPGIGNYTIGLAALSLIFNVVTYYRRKAKIEIFFSVFSYILRSLSFIEELSALPIKDLSTYLKELKTNMGTFQRFRRGALLVVSKKISGSLEDIILDYLRMIFHFDLIKFDFMVVELKNKKESLNRLFDIVGLLDSSIAAASFRTLMDMEYCIPQLVNDKEPFLKTEDIYHPLIINPVKNSLSTDSCILLTGSNASGKSTFIKTVAINAILAQTIYTVLGKSYQSSFFRIYSSMALRDDIMSQESYYIVEIKSLKRIYDASGKETPILCFVDEVLRGTNTAERIAASTQILKSISLRNALCFAATHDIELTHILEKYYENYHFEEKIENNNVLFDYRLIKGRANSRNAIKLLGMMGYSQEIIDKATSEVNYFLENNQWNLI